jgi:hypothetical protein
MNNLFKSTKTSYSHRLGLFSISMAISHLFIDSSIHVTHLSKVETPLKAMSSQARNKSWYHKSSCLLKNNLGKVHPNFLCLRPILSQNRFMFRTPHSNRYQSVIVRQRTNSIYTVSDLIKHQASIHSV